MKRRLASPARVRLLVSVRDEHEARMVATAGVDLIDLKDPAAGALGALAPDRLDRIVLILRAIAPAIPVSATTGDPAVETAQEVVERVRRVAASGVDFVKVGIAPGPRSGALLEALAACGVAIIPVLLADEGPDPELLRAMLAAPAFEAVMLDTRAKAGGSLLQRRPVAELAAFVQAARSRGVPCGLAGALRLEDLPALCRLGPDYAGFRSAVCAGARGGALDEARLRGLCRGILAAGAGTGVGSAPGARGLERARQVGLQE